MFLETFGYLVLESGDSGEAFRMAQEYSGALPLMITDVVMPGFSGPVLAEKLAAARPDRTIYLRIYSRRVCSGCCTGSGRGVSYKTF